jgi:hypothetical protein
VKQGIERKREDCLDAIAQLTMSGVCGRSFQDLL